jgi:hypothetical protein
MTESLADMKTIITNTESMLNAERLRCKEELLKYSNQLKTIQETMLEMQGAVLNVQMSVGKLQPYNTNIPASMRQNEKPHAGHAPEAKDLLVDSKSQCDNYHLELYQTRPNDNEQENVKPAASNKYIQASQEESYAAVLCNNHVRGENNSTFGNMNIPTIVSTQSKPRKTYKNDTKRDINFKKINEELKAAKERQQHRYDRYTHDRNANYVEGFDNEDVDADFEQYVRRRTKQLFDFFGVYTCFICKRRGC